MELPVTDEMLNATYRKKHCSTESQRTSDVDGSPVTSDDDDRQERKGSDEEKDKDGSVLERWAMAQQVSTEQAWKALWEMFEDGESILNFLQSQMKATEDGDAGLPTDASMDCDAGDVTSDEGESPESGVPPTKALSRDSSTPQGTEMHTDKSPSPVSRSGGGGGTLIGKEVEAIVQSIINADETLDRSALKKSWDWHVKEVDKLYRALQSQNPEIDFILENNPIILRSISQEQPVDEFDVSLFRSGMEELLRARNDLQSASRRAVGDEKPRVVSPDIEKNQSPVKPNVRLSPDFNFHPGRHEAYSDISLFTKEFPNALMIESMLGGFARGTQNFFTHCSSMNRRQTTPIKDLSPDEYCRIAKEWEHAQLCYDRMRNTIQYLREEIEMSVICFRMEHELPEVLRADLSRFHDLLSDLEDCIDREHPRVNLLDMSLRDMWLFGGVLSTELLRISLAVKKERELSNRPGKTNDRSKIKRSASKKPLECLP